MIDLDDAKAYLDVIHGADDPKLQMLLDAAVDEALQFMNRESLSDLVEDPSSQSTVPPSVVLGVMLLLQAAYQATPEDANTLRKAAEVKLTPYRILIGV